MIIAIISDLHDNTTNLDKFLNWCHCNGVDKIISLGDLTDNETYKKLTNNFAGEIFCVYGNADSYTPESPEILSLNIAGLKLALVHKPYLTRQLIEEYNPDYVLYGHTHKPELVEHFNMGKRVWLLNPGTLGGVFYRASFAVIKDGIAELKLLELV